MSKNIQAIITISNINITDWLKQVSYSSMRMFTYFYDYSKDTGDKGCFMILNYTDALF